MFKCRLTRDWRKISLRFNGSRRASRKLRQNRIRIWVSILFKISKINQTRYRIKNKIFHGKYLRRSFNRYGLRQFGVLEAGFYVGNFIVDNLTALGLFKTFANFLNFSLINIFSHKVMAISQYIGHAKSSGSNNDFFD